MKIFFQLIAGSVIIATLLPFVRSDYWTFRVFEFPRVQKLILAQIIFLFYPFLFTLEFWYDWLLLASALSLVIYLFRQIYPFTFIAEKQLLKTPILDAERAVSLMMWNVYQYNRNAASFLKLSAQVDADVILLSETDEWWQAQLKEIEALYPYRVHIPLDNTYGMLLYSKLEIEQQRVVFLVEEGIPSIHAFLKLRSGQKVRLFCIHPTPPVPQENPRSTERDKELLMIANLARDSKLPVIVCGDLNDVAWSYTTLLFQKMSGLLDPRRGRGFFNTFHAQIPFLRFPLDHVFCSTDFTLVKMARLKNCGSDHFPMYIKLQYNPQATILHEEPQPTQEDVALAQEKIEKETRSEGPQSED